MVFVCESEGNIMSRGSSTNVCLHDTEGGNSTLIVPSDHSYCEEGIVSVPEVPEDGFGEVSVCCLITFAYSLTPAARICFSCTPIGRTRTPFLRRGRAGQERSVELWGPLQFRHLGGLRQDPS